VLRKSGIAFLVACLVAVTFAGLWLWRIVPGSAITDWITAISALGALLFAGIAAVATYGQLTVLKEEANQRAIEQKNEQARLVYWAEKPGEFTLFNLSTEPILRIVVIVEGPGDDIFKIRLGDLYPTGREGASQPTLAALTSRISEKWGLTEFKTKEGISGMYGGHCYDIAVVFSDSAGRRWIRKSSMTLEETRSETLPRLTDHAENIVNPRTRIAINEILDERDRNLVSIQVVSGQSGQSHNLS
jgi:hypothetical protein